MKSQLKTTIKITLEILLLFVLAIIIGELFNVVITRFVMLSFDCNMFDRGFFKAPGFYCTDSPLIENFLFVLGEIGMISLFSILTLIYYFYITIPIIILVSYFASKRLHKVESKQISRKFFVLVSFLKEKFKKKS